MGVLIANRTPFSINSSNLNAISTAYIHSVGEDTSGNAVFNKINPDGSMSVDLVSVNNSKLDPYVSYNSELDQIVSRKALQTTLSSLYLKEQHSMSSGYENIFFKNLTSNVAWFPTWQGVKMPQTLQENRGDDGIYKPTGRVYLTDVLDVERFGTYIPDGDVEFDEYSYFENKNSVYGLDCILAENIGTDIQVKFFVQKDGRDTYEQLLPIQNYFTNQTLRINFSIPLESHGQEYISISLCKIRLSDNTDVGFVKVRPAVETDNLGQIKVWAKLYLRLFDDKLLAFKDDLLDASGVSYSDLDTRLTALENAHSHTHTDDHEQRISDIETALLNTNNNKLIEVENRFQAQRTDITQLQNQILELQNQISNLMPE